MCQRHTTNTPLLLPPHQIPLPFVDSPFANGVRVQGHNGDSYLNAAGAADGLLHIIPVRVLSWWDESGEPIQWGVNFTNMVTVVIEGCQGNFSWTKDAGHQVFRMQEPTDTLYTKRDMSDFTPYWNGSASFTYANAIVTAYVALRGLLTADWDAKKAIELMLLSIPLEKEPPQPFPRSINFSNPSFKALRDSHATQEGYFSSPCFWSKTALISGVISSHGADMTAIGSSPELRLRLCYHDAAHSSQLWPADPDRVAGAMDLAHGCINTRGDKRGRRGDFCRPESRPGIGHGFSAFSA